MSQIALFRLWFGSWLALGLLLTADVGLFASQTSDSPLGLFTAETDIGTSSSIGAGSATYDSARKSYTIIGGGENMWGTSDHFHYIWKRMSGDVLLEATIAFVGSVPSTGAPEGHRKACLVIRQTLEPDSVYADAALHGDGLTSLQWREVKGGVTTESRSDVVAPSRLRIEKRGDQISMSVAPAREQLRPSGWSARVRFVGDFYVGLGVTAHNRDRLETAAFTDVIITTNY
jgi:TolB protein